MHPHQFYDNAMHNHLDMYTQHTVHTSRHQEMHALQITEEFTTAFDNGRLFFFKCI